MVAPALIGAGISALGGIFGGRSKKKAAKKAAADYSVHADDSQRMIEGNYNYAIEMLKKDNAAYSQHAGMEQARAIGMSRQDQARAAAMDYADQMRASRMVFDDQARSDARLFEDENRANAYRAEDEARSDQRIGEDQARALAYRADDEARLRAATGFDLVKLVKDSELAGFNPLTVLNATGAAGYDGRGAVLTSPFMARTNTSKTALLRSTESQPFVGSRFIETPFLEEQYRGEADGYFNKAAAMDSFAQNRLAGHAGTGQAVASTAGYFGDALSGLGNAFMDITNQGAQRNHEMDMLRASQAPVQSRSAAGGFAPSRKITSSPSKVAGNGSSVSVFGTGRAPNLYPGMGQELNPETVTPLTGWGVDPLFGSSWLIANPDLDNEWLELLGVGTLPLQAAAKGGPWISAAGGSASRPQAGRWNGKPGSAYDPAYQPGSRATAPRAPFRTPNRAEVWQ